MSLYINFNSCNNIFSTNIATITFDDTIITI